MPKIGAGRNVAIWAVIFLFVFGWKITYVLDIIALLSVGAAIVAYLWGVRELPRNMKLILASLLLLSAYSLCVVILAGSAELEVAERSVRATVNFIGAWGLFSLMKKIYRETVSERILFNLWLAIVVHGGLMAIMYLQHHVRDIIYGITDAVRYVNLNTPFLAGLRVTGLTYGLSQTSVIQMHALLISTALAIFWIRSRKWPRLLLLIPASVVIVFSMAVSGVSGFVIGGLVMVAVGLWRGMHAVIRPIRRVGKAKELGLALMPWISIALGLSAVVAFLPNLAGGSYLEQQMGEALLFFQRKGETETTVTLRSMFFLPDKLLHTLFGGGGFGRGELGYVASDIGYVRLVFGIGVIGTVLTLLPYLLGLAVALKKGDSAIAVVTVGILLSGLILNFKEVALLTRNQWSVQSLLLFACADGASSRITKRKRSAVVDLPEA